MLTSFLIFSFHGLFSLSRAFFLALPVDTYLFAFAVFEYGLGVYANIQFNMYDVVNWTLERLFAIFGANAARIPVKLMGCN